MTPAEIQAIAVAVRDLLLRNDGPLHSPPDAADHATNPNWAWGTHIEATTVAARGAYRDAHAGLAVATAARVAAEKALAAATAANKILTGTADAPGVLPRIVDVQSAVARLAALLAEPGKPLGDLAAVQEAARAGAAAGAALDGAVLTVHQSQPSNGGTPA